METQRGDLDLRIEVITDTADIIAGFDVICRAFGEQTKDAIFACSNPGWDTPAGKQKGAERLAARLTSATLNRDGKPNTVFLKATVVDADAAADAAATRGQQQQQRQRQRVIAGMAVWMQVSAVAGYGDMPPEDEGAAMDVASIHPGEPARQKFLGDVLGSLHAQRRQLVRDKAGASPPAVMALDLCAVDPRFQGRGIARRLVEWGLREARDRGDLEAVTEASVMGRRLYLKMGFEQEGPEIVYDVDEALIEEPLPSNIFIRTRKP